MDKIKLAKNLSVLVFVYFIVYNTYFGWNMKPISENETLCDNIFDLSMVAVFFFYFLPIFTVYEKWLAKWLGEDKIEITKELEKELEQNSNLITEAVNDVIVIAQMNNDEEAKIIIRKQYLIINRQDLKEK